MSMDSADLANLLKSNLQDLTDVNQTMNVLASTIEDYVSTNLQIRFTWSGMNIYGPYPDSVTVAYGTISNLNINLTLSNLTSKTTALDHIENELQVSFQPTTYTITDAGFVVSTGTFIDIPTLTISISVTTDRDTAMLNLATSIIDWLKNYVPSTPVTGIRVTVYTGTGTPNLIF